MNKLNTNEEEERKKLEIASEIARGRKRDLEDIGMIYNEKSNFLFYGEKVVWMEDVLRMDGPTFNAEHMKLKMEIKNDKCKKDKIRDDEIRKAKEEAIKEADEKRKMESIEKTQKLFGGTKMVVIDEKPGGLIEKSFVDDQRPSTPQTAVTLNAPIPVNEFNSVKQSNIDNNYCYEEKCNYTFPDCPYDSREQCKEETKKTKPVFQMEEVDIETKRRKNNEILSDLIQELNMSEPYAKNVIKAIFQRKIRNVRIQY